MEYIVLIVLFFLSAFFSGAETALTSVKKYRMETKAENGDKKAKKVLRLVESPEKMLTTILIGNNFVNILISSLATSMAIAHFGSMGVLYSTVIVTIVLLVFSEITPKSIAAVFSERISYWAVWPITIFMNMLRPIVFLMSKFTNGIIALFSKKMKKEETVSSEDLKVLVHKGSQEGIFHRDESNLITSVIDFKDKEAGDALKTPRVDIVAISSDASFEEVREIIQKEQYSRYPVYEEKMENIIGFFYAKDFVTWSSQPEKAITNYIDKDVLYVPETMSIDKLFKEMQNRRKHVAIVVDEYGGTEGLISLEDVIEEMIGQEINDEKDEEEVWIEEIDKKTFICMADIKMERVKEFISIEVDEEIDTLGEFALHQLEKIPKKGDKFLYESYKFTIKEMDRNRILKIEIKQK